MDGIPDRTSTRVVSDTESLRAIAHPLRLELLGWLRGNGPATASTLGRVLGESSGSTSYHLRQLERFGFIEPDPEQPSRREKVWRARHARTEFGLWEGAGEAELAAVDAIVEVQLRHLVEGVRRRQRDAASTPPAWRDALVSSDLRLTVTADRMRWLGERIEELVGAAERASADDPEAQVVELHLQSFLVAATEGGAGRG